MSLRVIAGSAKGMRLKPVPGDSTRPIMDRVKESLFSIIGQDIVDSVFLDLFGGTGSVGIEALSRGAEHVLFIDNNRRAIKILRENLVHTRLHDKATIIQRDAFDLISQVPDKLYHFIYIAPPQYKKMWIKALQTLDSNMDWHHDKTTIIVQIDPDELDPSIRFQNLVEYDRRKYGRTMLIFYEFNLAKNSDEQDEDTKIE